MSKIRSKNPIFLKDFEHFEKIRLKYVYIQSVWYYCINCGNIQTNLSKNVRKNGQLLCRKCQQKKTNLEKYGVEWAAQSKIIKNKKIKNSLEKYGVDSPNKLKSIKIKQKQNKDFKKIGRKISKSKLKWYKLNKESFLQKFEKTSLKNWGTKYPNQSLILKQKLKIAHSKMNEEDLRKSFSKRKKYKYQGQTFDSSWELALWIYAKDHNEEIEREPCCFEYEYGEINHKYFPDFKYKGQLIEIKSDFLYIQMQIPNTKENAKLKCIQKNNVQIWIAKDVKTYIEHINLIYGKNYLQQFKNK